MPLIILSGYPSSGKSWRAKQIEEYFVNRINDGTCDLKSVHVISDESLHIAKQQYQDRETEKKARGAQMAAVKKHLSASTLVILDNLSYIKGFRYQLFCEAKAHSTNSCVVYVGVTPEDCKEMNNSPTKTDPWPQELLDNLIFRYEEPNGLARWDSPLFILPKEDEINFDELYEVLVLKQPMKPNAATSVKAQAPTSYLEKLNEETKEITQQVLSLHRDAPGATVLIAGKQVQLPMSLTLPQINRIRRNFIQLNKPGGIHLESIGEFFIEFLEKNWNVV